MLIAGTLNCLKFLNFVSQSNDRLSGCFNYKFSVFGSSNSIIVDHYMQILGYGWAGMLRRYLVDPAEMWWPSNLAQVSLFRSVFYSITLLLSFVIMIFFLVDGKFLRKAKKKLYL